MKNVHLLYMFMIPSASSSKDGQPVLEGAYTSKAKAQTAEQWMLNGAKDPEADINMVLAGGNLMHWVPVTTLGEQDRILYTYVESVTVE